MEYTSSREQPNVIALLTDFGLRDGYVGVMKGVIAQRAPAVHCIDITHDIAAQDIAGGAWVLATSYRYFPANTIFVCVVDPGVGSSRHPIVLHAGQWYFVGPDNGIFSYVLTEQPRHAAYIASNPVYHLEYVSATFQGRDIFAPVAAHIASGVSLSSLGEKVSLDDLKRLNVSHLEEKAGFVIGKVAHIDHFGNVITNIHLHKIPSIFVHSGELILPRQQAVISECRRFFADETGDSQRDSQPFFYEDSAGYLGIALRNRHAAVLLGVKVGDTVQYRLNQDTGRTD